MIDIQAVGQSAALAFIAAFIFIICLMGGLLWFGWWVSRTRGSVSPYSKKPMMLGVDLPASIGRHIEEFVHSLPKPENKTFDYTKAAICRETGRIFPNVVIKGEIIRLKWEFLNDRYQGNWVSWGSIPETTRAIIRLCHDDMAYFQTQYNSPERAPSAIDMHYAMMKPGPLYVDVMTKILLGWRQVPGTSFEILQVQKPKYESLDERM